MLNPNERQVLELLKKNHLMTTTEMATAAAREKVDSLDVAVARLRDRGLIDSVQNMGNYVVITKKGMQALKGE